MASFRVGPNELYYERSGAGEPLILIMGMSGTHLSWGEPFLDALRRDFDVVIYDHRGMGKSGRTEPTFTIGDLAEDAVALLDELGWDSAHVCGISMGGMVAQELVLRHPERVRTLTLGCTYAGGAGATLTSPEVGTRLFESMQSGDRERALRVGWEVNVSRAFAADEAQYAEFRRRAIEVPANLPTIMAQMQAIMPHNTSARLGEISAPTLVIHGTDDEMLSYRNGEAIASAIPGARLEILDGIGHLFFWEEPERSAALIREHALAHASTG
jgi:3-oxoadipate enol-lactonase